MAKQVISEIRELINGRIAEVVSETENRCYNFNFEMAFDALTVRAYQIAKDHGWHEQERNDGEVLSLIHSEISEALQALRAGNPPDKCCPEFSNLEIELADAIIRIMDYAAEKNLDISGAIVAKMEYNKNRPYKHGKNF